jgi:ATP-binding cassette subfamily B protein
LYFIINFCCISGNNVVTKEKQVLKEVSFTVQANSFVALVGESGCGKSTIASLIMGNQKADAGNVTIGGVDINEIAEYTLYKKITRVRHDSYLFKGTLLENLKMGKPEATDEEMIAAAKKAHAHSFIKRMAQGYDTPLREDGGNLSEGQKQLLCIARIMLAQPPMLILDEATSSIDTRTERKISDAFEQLMQGRTSFIVAHRLSTIVNADTILVMEAGRVVEQGTNAQLLQKNGTYAKLYNGQFA